MRYRNRYDELTSTERAALSEHLYAKLSETERAYLWGVFDGQITRGVVLALVLSTLVLSTLALVVGLAVGAVYL